MERNSKIARKRRHIRVRKRVSGTATRPRLCVYRSLKHIYAQIVDDEEHKTFEEHKTLVAVSTLSKELASKVKYGGNVSSAKEVGVLLAKKAKEAGINRVVFDRGGYLFHGRVKELAQSAREGGLEF